MAFIPFVNAAVTRKNDVGQKWIIVLKEKKWMPLGRKNSAISSCFD